MNILCKWRDALVLMEAQQCEEGSSGKCPECGSTNFTEVNGWATCDCGFAFIYKKEYEANIDE